jgi:hypothetical protein
VPLKQRLLRSSRSLAWAPVVLLLPVSASASPPAAIDLSRTWSIDIHLSDHAEQIARAIEIDTGELKVERPMPPGPRGGAGVADAPELRKSDGTRPGRELADARMSADERKVLAELIRPIQFPPLTLTVTQSDTMLTIKGDRAPYEMRTDGKAEKHALESGTVKRTAQWVGPQLRVVYEVGHAGLLTYTYTLVPSTGQLLIRVNFERLPGYPGPFDIKLVYNRSKAF